MGRRVRVAVVVVIAALALLWVFWPSDGRSIDVAPELKSQLQEQAKVSAPIVDSSRGAATPGVVVEAPGGETIEVHVTLDGAPVKDATLTASKQRPTSSSWRPTWEPSLNQRTNELGVAVFPASTGTWVVSVAKEGFATAVVDVPKPSGEPITVVRVQLEHGHELRGVAIDSAKSAVAPATIRAVPLGDRSTRRWSSPAGISETSVDERGSFHFTGLAAGWWRIEGEAEGAGRAQPKLISMPTSESITLRFRRSGFLEGVVLQADGGVAAGATVAITNPEGADSLEASSAGTFSNERMPGSYRVSARLGEWVGAADQVALVRAGATTSTRVVLSGKGGTLMGTVKRDDGIPVEGAVVVASVHNDDGISGQAISASDGTWSIGNLPRGSYDLEAEAKGLTRGLETGFFLGGGTVEVDLVLGRFGKITGTVETSTGAPLATRVSLRARSGAAERQAQADSSGHFAFDDVAPGAAFVRAIGKEDEFNRPTNVMVKAGETSEVKLVVPELVVVDVELDRTRCTKGAEVTVTAVEGDSWQNRISRAVPPELPRVTLKMSPGVWALTGGSAIDESCVITGQRMQRLELKEGQARQKVPLVFGPREAGFKVTVLEADGQPSPLARVTGRDEKGGMWSINANSEGVAEVAFPEDAVLSITASNQGRGAQLKGVRRSSGHVTITLGPASHIHLRLEGAVGITSVAAYVDGEHYVDELRVSGVDGVLEEIPPGSITLVAVSADESSMGRTRVTTTPGQTAEASIRLEQAGQVRGRAQLPAGVTSGWVSLTSSLGGFDGARVQPDGAFRFERVVAGDYVVKVMCKDCSIPPKPVKVVPGGNLEVVLP